MDSADNTNKNENKENEKKDLENKRNLVDKNGNLYTFNCPHCDGYIEVEEQQVACQIFRHGTFKQPGLPPINPHASKEECERLLRENLILGCAKPFKFFFAQPQNYVEPCDYI